MRNRNKSENYESSTNQLPSNVTLIVTLPLSFSRNTSRSIVSPTLLLSSDLYRSEAFLHKCGEISAPHP